MKNYLLDCDLRGKIEEKLLQLRACALLINETTNPHTDNRNDNVSTCAWMIADELSVISALLEKLPIAKNKKGDE